MTTASHCWHCQYKLPRGVAYDSCPKCHGSFSFPPAIKPATSTTTKKMWVAVDKAGRFLRWTEHDYDMTGYGGSTGSTYSYSSGTDLAKATIIPDKDFPPFPSRYGKVQYRRVAVITTFKLLKP